MKVLSIHDKTQEQICAKLAYTEHMVAEVLKMLNGSLCDVEITAFEDLGFSNNLMRMRGGFYTGTAIKWESRVPFVPVDSTVNSCGVSIFKLSKPIQFQDFKERITKLDYNLKKVGITNNFANGNHFISYCIDQNNQQYLVVHASDNSYKFGNKGLYPREDTWYYDKIKIMSFDHGYIRFLSGNMAERFYNVYLEAEKSNPVRNRTVAEILLEKYSDFEEILYSPHYGMPNMFSIAIGSQWKNQNCVLLSYEGAPVFILRDRNKQPNYLPHGFGLTISGDCNSFSFLENNKIIINGIVFRCNDGFLSSGIAKTRNSDLVVDKNAVYNFMPTRNISIDIELKQCYSYTRNGISIYK